MMVAMGGAEIYFSLVALWIFGILYDVYLIPIQKILCVRKWPLANIFLGIKYVQLWNILFQTVWSFLEGLMQTLNPKLGMWYWGVLHFKGVALDDKDYQSPPEDARSLRTIALIIFIYLYDWYLSSTYYVSVTVLGTGDIAVTK